MDSEPYKNSKYFIVKEVIVYSEWPKTSAWTSKYITYFRARQGNSSDKVLTVPEEVGKEKQ